MKEHLKLLIQSLEKAKYCIRETLSEISESELEIEKILKQKMIETAEGLRTKMPL